MRKKSRSILSMLLLISIIFTETGFPAFADSPASEQPLPESTPVNTRSEAVNTPSVPVLTESTPQKNLLGSTPEEGTEDSPWLIGADPADSVTAWLTEDPEDDSKYILNIEPASNGAVMMDFSTADRPWESVKDSITGMQVLESGLKNIGENAFSGLTALKTAELSDTEIIGKMAFKDCKALERITIPEKAGEIGGEAFSGCLYLRNITIRGRIMNIAKDAFKGVLSHIYVTKWFLSDRHIYNGYVTQINDPNGAWYYGADMLSYSIISPVGSTDRRHVVSVNQQRRGTVNFSLLTAFEGNENYIELSSYGTSRRGEIKEIRVNGNAVDPSYISLERQTYYDKLPSYIRMSLYKFYMPAGDVEFKVAFEEDDDNVNYYRDYLGNPPDVPLRKEEEDGNVWKIASDGTNRVTGELSGDTLTITYNGPPGRTFDMMDFNHGGPPWDKKKASIVNIVVGEGVSSLGVSAFELSKHIENVSLPKTLKKISKDAFYSTSVKNITIPANVNEIGEDAFHNCRSFKTVTFEGRPQNIHKNAFRLSTVTAYIPSSWLSDGVTLDDLNTKPEYQYGGTITYKLVKKPDINTPGGREQDTDITHSYTRIEYTGSKDAVYTGTPESPVSDGTWSYDSINDVWTYKTSQLFRNCWAYIVNPFAGEGQNRADWFLFDEAGSMLTGWQQKDGRWYYLNTSKDGTRGACLIGPGRTPDGYEIDAEGAWTGR